MNNNAAHQIGRIELIPATIQPFKIWRGFMCMTELLL